MAFFSTASADYANAINSLVKPTYESKYNNKIEEQLNKILNREDFSYDFNADPLYQNYKDQYTKLGKEAAMNASASASALTGGYGNSYAGTAASQANQQYLTQLNERIPELYNAAMNKYQMETENLYNQFGALQTEESRQYGMHRDNVSDYYNDWGNLQQGFSTAQAHEEWQEGMDYQKARDAVSDAQWNKQIDYNFQQIQYKDDRNCHYPINFSHRISCHGISKFFGKSKKSHSINQFVSCPAPFSLIRCHTQPTSVYIIPCFPLSERIREMRSTIISFLCIDTAGRPLLYAAFLTRVI